MARFLVLGSPLELESERDGGQLVQGLRCIRLRPEILVEDPCTHG